MNEKKYQVFISSTYTDLIEERKKILNILLMADCIPAGMEAFTATDLEQFEVIKRVIDLCDYYVLIIGKRYGSINPDTGISYTEMEYNYALEQGIPVLVFALDSSVNLPPEKTESDADKIKKLDEFRARAMTNRLASVWLNTEDLTGKLAISIMKAKSEIKRPGWQRSLDFDEASLRREIMELQEKNQKLCKELEVANDKISSFLNQKDVAFDDCEIKIDYYYLNYSQYHTTTTKGSKTVQLKDIFVVIATQMMDVLVVESSIKNVVAIYIESEHTIHFNDKQIIKKILNQLRAVGLVRSNWNEQNKALYWGLTEKGVKIRDDMILIRNKNDNE